MLDERAVFLFDVDNTLLDNDRFGAELGDRLEARFGAEARRQYWEFFTDLRVSLGFADYLAALQAFRRGRDDDPELLGMADYLLDYPFADLLFPQALAVIRHVGFMGRPVVLSDGDIVLQPRKIKHSGIWDAVDGAVLIYVHKELVLDHVQRRYPAPHYVMIDDKPNLLGAMKAVLGGKLTTVFVRQGHYALAGSAGASLAPPDRVIERIGDLASLRACDFEARP